MKVFIDESMDYISFASVLKERLHNVHYVEVPVRTQVKELPLATVIQQNKLWRRRLKPKGYTLEELLLIMLDNLDPDQDQGLVFYFFDPTVTDEQVLLRIKNLIYPEYCLVPVNATANRAILFCLMSTLLSQKDELSRKQDQQLSSASFKKKAKELVGSSTQYVITTHAKPWKKQQHQWKIFRKRKKDKYVLVQTTGTKTRIIGKGPLRSLIGDLTQRLGDAGQHYAVAKGLEPQHTLENVTWLTLDEHSVPVNVPYIHVISTQLERDKTKQGSHIGGTL